MKKVKMLLIAFSLLACSSFAFATEKFNEEEKEEVTKILNNSSELLKNIEKKLQEKGLLENGFLTILDNSKIVELKNNSNENFILGKIQKIKTKKLPLKEFFLEVAKDSSEEKYLVKKKKTTN